jgi:hypothetical protein
LAEKKVNPIEAMRRGGEQLEKERQVADKTIGSFWEEYIEEKQRGGKLTARRASHWKSFHSLTRHGIMTAPLKTFLDEKEGRAAVVKMFKDNPSWRANTTGNRIISTLKLFLQWIALRPEGQGLSRPILKEIFNREVIYDILPAFSKKREKRVATMEQVRSLFELVNSEEGRGLAGWFVAKLWLGARTKALCGETKISANQERWRWDMFDLDNGRVNVPAEFTKTKNSIEIDMATFPNLLSWMRWANAKDEITDPNAPLCDYCASSIGNKLNAWMNKPQNKEIWAVKNDSTGKKDLREGISLAKDWQNFQRRSFITYGLQIARNTTRWTVDDVSRTANDYKSHKHYVKDGVKLERAKEYFGCRPDDLYATLGF